MTGYWPPNACPTCSRPVLHEDDDFCHHRHPLCLTCCPNLHESEDET